MNKDLSVTKTVAINASPQKVWSIITSAESNKQFFFGADILTDWKSGSEIVFSGNYGGRDYRDHGVILEGVRYKTIKYSYWSSWSGLEDKPEHYSLVEFHLKEVDSKTELSVIQTGFANETGWEHSQTGWEQVTAVIKQLSEN